MSSPLPDTAAAACTRAIRSYAHREDAERARDLLADSGIPSVIQEFRAPDPATGQPTLRGCSLAIRPADASASARLLLKMPPSEAPSSGAKTEGPTRLRRRPSQRARQSSGLFMIVFAVICVAGMILFAAWSLLRPKSSGPSPLPPMEITEDTNGDGFPDVWRSFAANGVPLSHVEDRNGDAVPDIRWIWLKGVSAYRDVDLNADGKWDERTTYDREAQPFFTDLRPGSAGPVLRRTILRQDVVWKVLTDSDADSHFDHLTEFDLSGDKVRDETLPPGSPEDVPVPPWPVPPWPDEEEEGSDQP